MGLIRKNKLYDGGPTTKRWITNMKTPWDSEEKVAICAIYFEIDFQIKLGKIKTIFKLYCFTRLSTEILGIFTLSKWHIIGRIYEYLCHYLTVFV